MKTPEQIKEYVRTHAHWTVRQMHAVLYRHGVNAEQIRAVRAELEKTEGAPSTPLPKLARIKPKSLDEFRKAHDIPQKIRLGLAQLPPSAYFTEEEFRQFCNVPANLWRRNAELPEFSDHKFKHAGVVHWAAKATITDMKRITGSA